MVGAKVLYYRFSEGMSFIRDNEANRLLSCFEHAYNLSDNGYFQRSVCRNPERGAMKKRSSRMTDTTFMQVLGVGTGYFFFMSVLVTCVETR